MDGSIFTHTLWIHRNGVATYDLYLYIVIWVNYDDLTATSLESWLKREIIPNWPYFRLLKYDNLPRCIIVYRIPYNIYRLR